MQATDVIAYVSTVDICAACSGSVGYRCDVELRQRPHDLHRFKANRDHSLEKFQRVTRISVAVSRESHCYRTILPNRITSNLQFAKCPLFRAFNAP